jgi:hypothetical protein
MQGSLENPLKYDQGYPLSGLDPIEHEPAK